MAMSGNEFRFFLSCDINLPVTFKIERLEGKLSPRNPPDSADDDCTIVERKPELYVESLLYVDGAPFGLPMRTRLESVGPSYCWNELITLSTKYRDLTSNSQLGLTVYDVSCGKNEEIVGGATIHLFNMKKQLKTGKHKLRLWSGKEADGSIKTTTPGKVPKEERGELERLEKLVNKYERGQIQRIDWLDRLAFKSMEKIKEHEIAKNGSSHFYVVVDFCSFEHRVVFQEIDYTKEATNAVRFAENFIAGFRRSFVHYGKHRNIKIMSKFRAFWQASLGATKRGFLSSSETVSWLIQRLQRFEPDLRTMNTSEIAINCNQNRYTKVDF